MEKKLRAYLELKRLLLCTALFGFTATSSGPVSSGAGAPKSESPKAEMHRQSTSLPAGDALAWQIRSLAVSFNEFAVFAMPGEKVELILQTPLAQQLSTSQPHDSLSSTGQNHWQWQAPNAAGYEQVVFVSADGDRTTKFNFFTKVPLEDAEGGRLHGFRIGEYPAIEKVSAKKRYQVPDGFIEVNAETQDILLSPHFRLKEFISKQGGGLPRYVYLKEALLIKLETLRTAMEDAGYPVDNLHVMSGFRTPYYNRKIGNVPFSRHVFGDAADVFVDNDRNGRMDDLNGDGKVDINDALVMQRVVDKMDASEASGTLPGGLGVYGPAPHRGPFIHVDTRGHRARWSQP